MGRTIHTLDDTTRAKDLADKTYIVTGANSGVGLETTRQLIKQGGHVVTACRRVNAGEEVASSFAGLGGTHEVMRLDCIHPPRLGSFQLRCGCGATDEGRDGHHEVVHLLHLELE